MEHFLFVAFMITWGFVVVHMFGEPKPQPIRLNKATAQLTIAAFKQLKR